MSVFPHALKKNVSSMKIPLNFQENSHKSLNFAGIKFDIGHVIGLYLCQTIEFLQKDFKEIYSSLKQRQYIDTITS